MKLLEVKNLKKVYKSFFGGVEVKALKDINFDMEEGEFTSIMGESGSGKTTLLNLISAIDTPTSGSIILKDKDFSKIKASQRAEFRRDRLGFVFQEFNLLDTFSVEDNILLPLVLAEKEYKEMAGKVEKLANSLGIGGILKKYPYEISGGQRQRTAVARALISEPEILLADEPTGALDSKSSDELLNLFSEINKRGQSILMVTHSVKAASKSGRVLFIKDGRIFSEIRKENSSDMEFYKLISEKLIEISEEAV